jgi:hypothetical protein
MFSFLLTLLVVTAAASPAVQAARGRRLAPLAPIDAAPSLLDDVDEYAGDSVASSVVDDNDAVAVAANKRFVSNLKASIKTGGGRHDGTGNEVLVYLQGGVVRRLGGNHGHNGYFRCRFPGGRLNCRDCTRDSDKCTYSSNSLGEWSQSGATFSANGSGAGKCVTGVLFKKSGTDGVRIHSVRFRKDHFVHDQPVYDVSGWAASQVKKGSTCATTGSDIWLDADSCHSRVLMVHGQQDSASQCTSYPMALYGL